MPAELSDIAVTVFRRLVKAGPATRPQISAALGVSKPGGLPLWWTVAPLGHWSAKELRNGYCP